MSFSVWGEEGLGGLVYVGRMRGRRVSYIREFSPFGISRWLRLCACGQLVTFASCFQ